VGGLQGLVEDVEAGRTHVGPPLIFVRAARAALREFRLFPLAKFLCALKKTAAIVLCPVSSPGRGL